MVSFVECNIRHEDSVKNFLNNFFDILLFIYNISIYVVFNYALRISMHVGTGKKLDGTDCHLT
jgi:hypothetical protein